MTPPPADSPASHGHRRIVLAALAGLACALAGCAVGPDYHAPKTELSAFHSQAGNTNNTATAPALDQWWSGFNDPELVKIVQQALIALGFLQRVQLCPVDVFEEAIAQHAVDDGHIIGPRQGQV